MSNIYPTYLQLSRRVAGIEIGESFYNCVGLGPAEKQLIDAIRYFLACPFQS